MEPLFEEVTVARPLDFLLAVAGGIIGGVLTLAGLWAATWALLERRHRRPA